MYPLHGVGLPGHLGDGSHRNVGWLADPEGIFGILDGVEAGMAGDAPGAAAHSGAGAEGIGLGGIGHRSPHACMIDSFRAKINCFDGRPGNGWSLLMDGSADQELESGLLKS
jgi:hypothetical protein